MTLQFGTTDHAPIPAEGCGCCVSCRADDQVGWAESLAGGYPSLGCFNGSLPPTSLYLTIDYPGVTDGQFSGSGVGVWAGVQECGNVSAGDVIELTCRELKLGHAGSPSYQFRYMSEPISIHPRGSPYQNGSENDPIGPYLFFVLRTDYSVGLGGHYHYAGGLGHPSGSRRTWSAPLCLTPLTGYYKASGDYWSFTMAPFGASPIYLPGESQVSTPGWPTRNILTSCDPFLLTGAVYWDYVKQVNWAPTYQWPDGCYGAAYHWTAGTQWHVRRNGISHGQHTYADPEYTYLNPSNWESWGVTEDMFFVANEGATGMGNYYWRGLEYSLSE